MSERARIEPRVSPQRWRDIEALFEACLGLAPGARDALLAGRCADDASLRQEVEELLAHAEATDRLDEIVDRSRQEVLAGSSHGAGDLVGAYRLESRLGEGGMGSVWRARRADDEFEQQVAIKLVRAAGRGRGWVERFRAERQILARLEHPHIARLLDGGSTADGQPYLVMELVEGEELIAFCDRRRLGLRDRLGLFLQIADAVEHAHRYLIVHRDLKPANILVHPEKGPKLLDFGIAKILEATPGEGLSEGDAPALTLAEERLLTPDYASPEQILGQAVTTASDVYSLGVLLFELLTDQRPRRLRDLTPADRERLLTTSSPEKPSAVVRRRGDGDEPAALAARRGLRPSQLARSLRGDLDTIVLRALQTRPDRRYRSVAELAADVERFLAGRPIQARPDTWGYRARRLVQRHPWGAAATTVIAALVVAFVVNLIAHAERLEAERDRAVAAEAKALTVSDFLFQLFEGADPAYSRGEAVTARELLERGHELIEKRLADQPAVRAALLSTLADVYLRLGLNEPAADLHREALELRRALFGEGHLDTAASEDRLGDTLRRTTHFEEAEALLRRSLATRRAQLAPDDPLVAASLNDLGLLLKEKGDLEQAEPLLRRGLEIRVARLGPDHHDTNVSRSNLGQLLMRDRRHHEEASVVLEELVASRLRQLGEKHPDVANSLHVLASLRHEQGRLDEAEDLFRRAIRLRRATLPPNHPFIATSLNNLAMLLHDQVRLEEAEGLYREALAIDRQGAGADSVDYGYSLNNLGSLLEDRGRYAEAEELYLQSLAIRRQAFGEESRSFMRMLSVLGRLAVRRGELDLAGTRLRQAEAWQTAHLDPNDLDRIRTVERLGLLLRAKGAFDDSAAAFRTALELASRGGNPRQGTLAELHAELAWALAATRRPERCAGEIEAARALPGLATESGVVRGRVELAAGICLQALGRRDEAMTSLRAALELLRPGLGEANHWVREATRRLAGPRSPPRPDRAASST